MVDTNIDTLIPSHLADNSRLWVYQSDRALSEEETVAIDNYAKKFAAQWVSHQQELIAFGGVLYNRFVVLIVDDQNGKNASGCSIDSSVRFMQELGSAFKIDWFNRLDFTYLQEGEVKLVKKDDLPSLYASQAISDETLFFDNLIKTKGDLTTKWLVPLENSWHKRFV